MKRFVAFLKSTLLGGLIVVLPAWLAVLLVLKALGQLQVLIKSVSSHLPHSVAYPRVIAILVLIGLCFLVGALIQTAIGAKAEHAAERAVLEKIPGYTVLRSLASRLSGHPETASFQPVLVELEEALVPGFIVEQHSGIPFHRLYSLRAYAHGWRCLYHRQQPCSPPGSARYLRDAVHLQMGGGSAKLLAAYGAARSASLINTTNQQHITDKSV